MGQKTLTRAKLAEAICKHVGLSKTESSEILDQLFEIVSDALISGKNVKLANFGSFKLTNKKPRIGRNPKTLEEVAIASRVAITFAPSTNLKETIVDGCKGETAP